MQELRQESGRGESGLAYIMLMPADNAAGGGVGQAISQGGRGRMTVRMRSTASHSFRAESGTRWNASLPGSGAQSLMSVYDQNQHEPEGRANPEGWQRVAGGRSGQRGNDHRKTASDGRAPRRGARPSPGVLQPATLGQAPPRRCWHPCRGAELLRRCYPEVAAPKPPTASGYPLATLRVDRPKCPNSSLLLWRTGRSSRRLVAVSRCARAAGPTKLFLVFCEKLRGDAMERTEERG